MELLEKGVVDELIKMMGNNWSVEGTFLKREFQFTDFVEAFGFMTSCALEAEKANHHPNWGNVYNKVTVLLSTHDAGGITQKDFELAAKMDKLYKGAK